MLERPPGRRLYSDPERRKREQVLSSARLQEGLDDSFC